MPEVFVIETKRKIPILTIESPPEETKDNVLGFRITGGADFGMPITVFQVKEKSPAEQAGLVLGDSIVKINGTDATNMQLSDAQQVINDSGEDLQLSITKFAEDENSPQTNEVHEINFGGKQDVTNDPLAIVPPPLPVSSIVPVTIKTKDDATKALTGRENWIQPPERKVWHPIVWQQPPPMIAPEDVGKEGPHTRIVKNIRRLLQETVDDPEARKKHIDHIMLSLPTGSKDMRRGPSRRGPKRVEQPHETHDSDED